ncbi:dihydropteroate synthase [Demequina mangrovi]|uniref:Dihydropteroate synthase n=1 Tax=Demequina mangrovi TaxID=1043493 RepID=A0A1H6YE37_9MICO|nr:dihydropteroate synthase [Demequina mangrovi]SEJ39499.1 dihydropteroate synthase [Demequina mangrovi]
MTLVLGILNVTPDSFSDGGRFAEIDAAIAQGVLLARDGADLVDVGGESTRPGAARVAPEEEQRRVVPVVRALTEAGVATSIDTMHASTARAAVEAGATVVNDVSGGLADPTMAATVAELGVDYVAMHWRAHATEMDRRDTYGDVVAEVGAELDARVEALVAAGVAEDRIVLDPGLGFSKVTDSNWPLLANVDAWARGRRVLIGASRKRFLGAAIARSGVDAADPGAREHATTAVTALAAAAGAWGVRVHDAHAAADAVRVVSAWENARRP